ncbi:MULTISPECIES: endonuclease domain-containing protein [unclassified Brachybacterium]|uniref:endonuclease domain-containing protein n=1 Tax=unclassified Brachybacterium TaxID=2623841 RepID=UPI000C80A5E9|nr:MULTISPECIES: DUF559 domain-containing protein [unclassified Brachybacterium]PMC75073.1 DUF559 domain-containing protein [Brachybacterium sp. UMB0905]
MALRHAHDLRPGAIYQRKQLLAQGMHTRVLASDQILAPLPGFVTRADAPADLRTTVRALQKYVVPGAPISHVTAAEYLGLPLPAGLTHADGEPLHCAVERRGGQKATARIRLHESHPIVAFDHRGVNLFHPVRVLQQLSRRFSREDLVICVDALVTTGQGCVMPWALEDVRRMAGQLRGAGARAVVAATAEAREGVWSPMETRARLLLIDSGLPEPVPNLKVRDPSTGRHYYVDLAYPAERIAIEYDSDFHRVDRTQWQKDLSKDAALRRMGWRVLRISIADIRRPQAFLRALHAERAA